MRGVTHTLLGAAVAMPIAVSHSPAIAVGCLWFGVVGGVMPDWLDLRSELKTPLRLRHRGASHGLPVMALCVGLLWVFLLVIDRASFSAWNHQLAISQATRTAWVFAFGLGVASHLASDACTKSGIMPFLPFQGSRIWLLPRFLRSRSDGYLDTVARALAVVTLAFGLVVALSRWLDLG